MTKARGLGRGIEGLIASSRTKEEDTRPAPDGVWELAVDRIEPSPWQPRRNFNPGELQELALSIQDQGLISPLVVRRRPDGSHELIAGERRLRAVRDILKWEKAPARLMTANDAKAREITLVENLQRADLNPIEEAAAYQELQKGLGLTHDDIASRLHVSRVKVTNALRLFRLPDEVRKLVADGSLDEGKARAILGLENPLEQIRLARRAVTENLSTRQVEREAKPKSFSGRQATKKREIQAEALEERLRQHLGTRVKVEHRHGKGRIIIDYFSLAEAERVLDRMGLPPE
jgi:ParB family chromosome partitioning protein